MKHEITTYRAMQPKRFFLFVLIVQLIVSVVTQWVKWINISWKLQSAFKYEHSQTMSILETRT